MPVRHPVMEEESRALPPLVLTLQAQLHCRHQRHCRWYPRLQQLAQARPFVPTHLWYRCYHRQRLGWWFRCYRYYRH